MWTHKAVQSTLVLVALLTIPNVEISIMALSSTFGKLGDFATQTGPLAGENVLPVAVREMIGIARRLRLQDYALSPTLAKDLETVQRMTEGAWPVRLASASRHSFFAKNETLPDACRPLEAGFEVIYALCN